MKKCFCGGKITLRKGKTPEGVDYRYFRCDKCNEEFLDMEQLNEVAEKYRLMKKVHTKIGRWGLSLGVRIPKDLAKEYNLKENKEITLIPEKKSIRIVPV